MNPRSDSPSGALASANIGQETTDGWSGPTRRVSQLALLALGVSAAIGGSLAAGDALGYAVAGVLAAVVLMIVVGRLGLTSVLIWCAADEMVAPFVRMPTARAVITFDRVWLIASLGALILSRRPPPMRTSVRLVLAAYAVFGLAYSANALVTFLSTGDITAPTVVVDSYLLAGIALVLPIWLAGCRSKVRRVMIALCFGGVLNALLGISQLLWGLSFAANYNIQPRHLFFDSPLLVPSGGFAAPEAYAVALMVSEAAALYLMQTEPRKSMRVLAGVGVAIIVAGIAVTLLRSAWAAAILLPIIALTFRPGRVGWTASGVVSVTVLAAGAILGQIDPSAASSPLVATFERHTFNAEDLFNRLATYQQGFAIFLGRPLFGVGVQRYFATATESPAVIVGGLSSVPYAHDSFIGVLAEQGIVGFAAFMALLVAICGLLRSAFHRLPSPTDQALVASAIGACVGYLIMSVTFQMLPMAPSNAYLTVMLGCVAASVNAVPPVLAADSNSGVTLAT